VIEIAEIASGPFPPFETVTAIAPLAVPTTSPPKSRFVELSVAVGLTPVPLSGMTRVPSTELSAMVSVPVNDPETTGLNSTETVHDALAAIGLAGVQSSVETVNSAVALIAAMLSRAAEALVTVTVWGALAVPTA
jgi:hypothetical protein